MPRSRLAVALVIPGRAGTEIDAFRQALGSRATERIAPHVTLIPPVNVAEDRLPEALTVLQSAAALVPPIRLVLGPPATFLPRNPVLYMAVGGDVGDVRRLRDAANVAPIERIERRRFTPHVTIGERVDAKLIPALMEALVHYRAEVTITAVDLLSQDAERRWASIAAVPLGGSRVVARGGLAVTLTASAFLDFESQAFYDRAWDAHLAASYGPLPDHQPFAVAARREGAVVGVATGWTDDELILDRLVVDGAVRGQGIGRHLLAEVAAIAAARGCRRSVLVCQAAGPAPQWYEAHGWTVDLRLPGWRHGRDFVRMSRS